MGSTSFYPEEALIHTATVNAFGIERHPVTNAQFAEFVDATGYVTVAEKPLDPALYPVAEADLLPGALVFRPTAGPVDRRTGGSGGTGPAAPTGATRSAGAATSPAATTTRWCRWPTPTPPPTPPGRAPAAHRG
jgi:formylglycine-generating enzyme required for sulfatase activity